MNAAALACAAPISSIPINAYTDELALLQALRAVYYMNLGRSSHFPGLLAKPSGPKRQP